MRILHLAYEDPRQPGAGGGSVRTREINARLARHHEVTAIVAGYPGARPRVEDGVRWVPLHPRRGGALGRLGYFALLGAAARRFPHDLLVEDFGAPFSVGGSPLFTRGPLVASVQWLFADEMRRKYHLPFDLVERVGLPLYQDFVAVSDWLAGELRRRRPDARVTTVPNGVEATAFRMADAPPTHLLFVGRLDLHHKGGDLLLDAMRHVRAQLGDATPPLLIAGDGPDEATMRARTAALGLEDHVRFLGRVEGAAKYALMAGAHAVLMPSRFETFGMVAVEAQAAGAPVVTFDVGPLAGVAGGGGARLVQPFSVEAFAREAARLVTDPGWHAALRAQGRRWARQYDWNDLAARQEDVYLSAVDRHAARVRAGRA